MSVMNKPDYKIFAKDAKSGELVTFPDILRGWGVTLEQYNGFPPMELFNSAAKRIDEWLMYLTQRGLPEWDASVDYPKDALIQHTGIYYVALKVSKGEQPNNSQASWKKMSDFLGVDGKLTKNENGADIPDKPKFIENLGLGEAAKSGLVQGAGTSKTNVISQDGATKAFMQVGAHGLGIRAIGDNNKPTSLSGAGFYATGGDTYKQIPANTLLVRFQGTADRFIGCASDGSNRVFFTDMNGDPVDFYHSGNLRVLNSTGTSAANPISQKAATDNMLGVGQSWGDYSGNRQIGTGYTNATGKAIEVFCSCVLPISGTSSVSLEVNGLVISQSAATSPGGNIRGNVSGIIPAGASYKVITSNTTDVRIWVELR